ncbi:TPA: M48 family metalloprotease [Staphylococcus delphini]|nr:M48 family metalloprotease [Staphylococcus delphini]HEC2229057.1 M48 family metalloprotease [Staphylococcus delphini]
MRILAILIYLLVVLVRINIVKAPYLDENTKSLIFIFATLLIPTFIIRPIFNSSTKNLEPINYKELEESIDLPEGTKLFVKQSVLNNGIYVKGSLHKNSIIINPDLLNKLKIEELKFLIYHEICHIKNNDITKNQIYFALSYGVLPIILILISRFLDFKGTTQLVIYIIFSVILYFGGILLYFLRKRRRELKCDSYASKYLSAEIGVNALNALSKMGILKDTKLLLFADHPNLKKRLHNLKSD